MNLYCVVHVLCNLFMCCKASFSLVAILYAGVISVQKLVLIQALSTWASCVSAMPPSLGFLLQAI